VAEPRSERPPSVRHGRRLSDGTVVTVEYDHRGRVVRETYYWSPDADRLARILDSFKHAPRQSDD
jgi:hypothetical protein